MKIIFFDLPKRQEEFYRQALFDHELTFIEEKFSPEHVEIAKDADIISGFTDSEINKSDIDLLTNLKFIAARSTGFDHIDVAYANAKGIKVSNVPAYGSETVAEFAFALILTLSRKMREAGRALKENGDYAIPGDVQGFDLSGKTLGVIGTGKIGKNVIKIALAFNMKVVAYDLHPDAALLEQNNFFYRSFEEVMAESDIITLHAPSTKENFHLINKENISKMKKGVYLINTARGDLVDTGALASALEDGTVAGAGLDVLEGEGGFKKGDTIPMLGMPNVIMTPHIAFNTKEAELRIIQTTVDNIKGFVSGAPINRVE